MRGGGVGLLEGGGQEGRQVQGLGQRGRPPLRGGLLLLLLFWGE